MSTHTRTRTHTHLPPKDIQVGQHTTKLGHAMETPGERGCMCVCVCVCVYRLIDRDPFPPQLLDAARYLVKQGATGLSPPPDTRTRSECDTHTHTHTHTHAILVLHALAHTLLPLFQPSTCAQYVCVPSTVCVCVCVCVCVTPRLRGVR